MAPRLVVMGWDSATFSVIDPLLERGRLPAVRTLIERGVRATLRSTWPPMTDCAWTSAFTGVNAGVHGIFGSWYRAPGAYRCRYFSSRDRRVPALWELAPGVRFLVFNVPMTFPPTPIDGAMVAGYGAPPGGRFCEPAELQDRLAARWPLGDLLDRAPHGSPEAFLDDLVRSIGSQAEAVAWAAQEVAADCVVAVWPQIDRAQHFLWRFRGRPGPLGDAVERVYEAMDRATHTLCTAFPEADHLIVSDHGAGALLGDVNLGAWLVARGYARRRARSAPRLIRLAWALPPALRRAAKRSMPSLARRAVGATLAGQLGPFDWERTEAFVGFHGDLWINLRGREPRGPVSEDRAEPLLDELVAELSALEDPDTGQRLFAAAHRRDDLFHGPCAGLAPDLLLDSWSAGYRIAPGRGETDALVSSPSALAGVKQAWSADHRPEGVLVAAGPGIGQADSGGMSLLDVAPTCLALLEQAVPQGLDGRVATEALAPAFLQGSPVRVGAAPTLRSQTGEYSESEAAAVAEHLKDLGYIE